MRHVILTSRLDAEHGGLTASLLRKAGILARQAGLEPVIATFHDAHDFPDVATSVRDRYGLPPEVAIDNINHLYRAVPAPPGAPRGADAVARLCADLPSYDISWPGAASPACPGAASSALPPEAPSPREASSRGPLEAPCGGDSDWAVKLQPPRPLGVAVPHSATVAVGGKPVRRFWFRPDGTVFQSRELTGPPRGPRPVTLDPGTPRERRFKTFDGFRRHFMDELCVPPVTYLMCEARALDKALLRLENRAARKIFVFHSTHIRPGTSIIRTGNRALLDNLNQADALVVLTPQQRADVIERFGHADRIHVIPHAIRRLPRRNPFPEAGNTAAPGDEDAAAVPSASATWRGTGELETAAGNAGWETAPGGAGLETTRRGGETEPETPGGNGGPRTPGKVVMVARLSPEKDVGSALEAFDLVRRERPEARLEIWGAGPQEGQLRNLAQSLSLGRAVSFAGYTDNAQAVFRSAECSLLTSKWEGFGLTIMESMAAGTPCIAYNTDYGPAAMIQDGVNGHLVPPGDKEGLARRIVGFLGSPPGTKRAMAAQAELRMDHFSEERLTARWNALFAALVTPAALQPPLVKRLWRRVPAGPRNALGRLLGV
ncbi:MAG: glycosyltransferase [Bifidobacteriaceae bacterium]|nr:glycosyltransferase [Bifidobacteriaceae bacterium]